ncbi:hypothetical protein DPMN_126793 [Dreissena polymorpha]|uniref:Uncharacterized protein n=1 Tax=Dreissena polymorpha TaxID=45954 RepID=A0A9D4GXS0_DREPO|nr:hypothetical protein DPMN_126793 [Dreissena polymorpha]
MSHNWRSYTKKIKRSDSANTKPIDAFLKNDSSKTVETQQDSKVIDTEHCESESRQSAAVALSPSNTVADLDRLPIDNVTEVSKLTLSPGPSTETQLKTFPIIRSTPATLFSKPDETQKTVSILKNTNPDTHGYITVKPNMGLCVNIVSYLDPVVAQTFPMSQLVLYLGTIPLGDLKLTIIVTETCLRRLVLDI